MENQRSHSVLQRWALLWKSLTNENIMWFAGLVVLRVRDMWRFLLKYWYLSLALVFAPGLAHILYILISRASVDQKNMSYIFSYRLWRMFKFSLIYMIMSMLFGLVAVVLLIPFLLLGLISSILVPITAFFALGGLASWAALIFVIGAFGGTLGYYWILDDPRSVTRGWYDAVCGSWRMIIDAFPILLPLLLLSCAVIILPLCLPKLVYSVVLFGFMPFIYAAYAQWYTLARLQLGE